MVVLATNAGARSTPRRWPKTSSTDTATGRRLRLRVGVANDSKCSAARFACSSPPGELPHRPRSTRALAELAWLSLLPTRGTSHPTPLNKALLHRHRHRSAAAAPQRCGQSIRIHYRVSRARFDPWRTGRPRPWRGCLSSQRGARSTPCHWPRLVFTDTPWHGCLRSQRGAHSTTRRCSALLVIDTGTGRRLRPTCDLAKVF